MKEDKKIAETPLMKQYFSVKAQHPDALLLLGWETFMRLLVRMQLQPVKYWALFLQREEMELQHLLRWPVFRTTQLRHICQNW